LITTRISLSKTCEAADCYEAATETVIVSVGKLGTINLDLCHKCVVTKFRTTTKACSSESRIATRVTSIDLDKI